MSTETIFVLGPSLNAWNKDAPAVLVAGRRGVEFLDPPVTVGPEFEVVNLRVLPGTPEDKLPVNVYAFFVTPHDSVPAPWDRTPEWFFGSSAPRVSRRRYAACSGSSIGSPGGVLERAPAAKARLVIRSSSEW